MAGVIPMEIAASQALGYNLGVKLIRGAYMNEERELAEKNGYESPIWDSLEDTHKFFDDCVEMIMENMTTSDMIFIASHNVESVRLAMDLAVEKGFKQS